MDCDKILEIRKRIVRVGGDGAANGSVKSLERMISSSQQEKMHCAEDHIRMRLARSRMFAERPQLLTLADPG
jgi:hypothetical protein